MSTKKQFTPEEIRHLRANPYTRCVTADTISYTLAFKEAFWALSLQGYTGPAAFRKLGYNTEVLGFERVHNTTKRIRREAKSLEGLREGTRGGVRLQKETTSADSPSVEAARRMRREILEEHPHRERAVRIGRCVPLRLLQLGAFRTSQGNEGAEGPGRF